MGPLLPPNSLLPFQRYDPKRTSLSTSCMIFSVSEFSFLGAQPIRAGIESGLRKQIPSLELDHLPLADGEDPISGGGWGTEKPGPRKQSIVKVFTDGELERNTGGRKCTS